PRPAARFTLSRRDDVPRMNAAALPPLIPDVLQGEAEPGLVVMQTDHPFLKAHPLHTGRMVAAIPRDHPLAQRSRVALADLSPHPHIVVGTRMPYGMLVQSAFEQAGLPCRMCADVPWSNLACALVNAGVGIAMVDEYTVMGNQWPGLVSVPLAEGTPLHVSAVHATNRPLSKLGAQFLDDLRTVLQEAFSDQNQG